MSSVTGATLAGTVSDGTTSVPARRQILVLDARSGGRRLDVRIVDGVVAEVGDLRREARDYVVPAGGGEILGGLHDHHMHVLAAAARVGSVSLKEFENDLPATLQKIGRAVDGLPDGAWLRVVDYREETSAHSERGPKLDRAKLDGIAPSNPVRVQDSTGSLWVLNSRALTSVPADLIAARAPRDAEVDDNGYSIGRFHRMDAELATVWPESSGPLRALGEEMLRLGITGLTDATPTKDPKRTRALIDAHEAGELPQDLQILADRKIMLSDHALPDIGQLCTRIKAVHAEGQPVAIHTVTLESGFLACHALAAAGVLPGDRLEHAAVTTPELVQMIAHLGLVVVTQPGFIAERGEMYRRALDPIELDGIYRYRSLLEAGVRIAPSSDYPFGPLNPWTAIRAAAGRRTEDDIPLAEHESVAPSVVLRGYQSPLRTPGVRFADERWAARPPSVSGPDHCWSTKGVRVGSRADLCVLRDSLHEVFAGLSANVPAREGINAKGGLSPVAATLLGADVWHFDE